MTVEQAINSLNPQQKEAALYDGGPCLIVAGAGTGKTKTLTTKIAKLIADGYHPARILAVTFTNKAAGEMRERVDALVPGAGRRVWIHTFHSFGVRILRQNAEKLGLTKDFAIYDDSDQKKVVTLLLEQMGVKEPKKEVNQIVGIISRAKDEMVTPEGLMQQAAASGLDGKIRAAQIYVRYEQKLKEAGALDFGDLLVKTVVLLRDHPDVREYYQDFFQYVLVDEYQDTNRTQYLITKYLTAKTRKLCVVGDPDQSIYSWRGANIRNILEFEKDFKDAKIITLEQNYRSTKAILDASNRLITKNKKRKDKNLFTDKGAGEPITVHACQSEIQEAEWVSTEIYKLRDEHGASLKDIAVFYRTNAQSRLFEDYFRKGQIPYRLIGTVRFYDRKEVKDILCYARLLVNPADNVSLLRVINTPTRGLGDVAQKHLLAYAEQNQLPLFVALQKSAYVPNLGGAAQKSAMKLAQLFTSWQDKMQTKSPVEMFKIIIEESGYKESIKGTSKDPREVESRRQNLDELINAVKEYEERCERGEKAPGVADFLQAIALLSGEDDSQAAKDGSVTLMTVHLAKGLEFKNVFVTGLEENLFPIACDNEDDTEEERRLCYVAMTRAKEKLFLTFAQRRRKFGQLQENPPSRFLFESGLLNEAELRACERQTRFAWGENSSYDGGNYERFSARKRQFSENYPRKNYGGNYGGFSGYMRKSRFQKHYDEDGYEIEPALDNDFPSYDEIPSVGSLYAAPKAAVPRSLADPRRVPGYIQEPKIPAVPGPKNEDGVAVGGKVKHGVFGEGKIVQIVGRGESAKITVAFNNGTRRTFMLKFAPLEIL